jgi:hypothetical protein
VTLGTVLLAVTVALAVLLRRTPVLPGARP